MSPDSVSGAHTFMVPPTVWLDEVRASYLAEYVPAGGSAVKVIYGEPEALADTTRDLGAQAARAGCYYAHLDAGVLGPDGKRPDLHRIERFFLAVTADVDWEDWTRRQARTYLDEHGIRVAPGLELSDLDTIAANNGRQKQDLVNQFQREMATPQLTDRSLDIEFRTAVTALIRHQLLPETITPTTGEVIREWLRGRVVPGGAAALKRIQIYDRINRSTARCMLASFCRWLPRVGYSGLVVTVDVRAYEQKRLTQSQRRDAAMARVREVLAAGGSAAEVSRVVAEVDAVPEVTYSEQAFLEMLALIRHFIDEIDRFDRALLVFVTSPRFYDQDSPRGYFKYDALQTRIGQEVHDSQRANPSAALVRLRGTPC